MNFKKLFYLSILVLGTLLSCNKDENEVDLQTAAVITGPDLGQCICCGGYFIEINDSTYNFERLPAESNIDLTTETFPIEVIINWHHDRECGEINYITITKIQRN